MHREGPTDAGREIVDALFDLVAALKRRSALREDPATLFLLRHVRASTPLRVSDLACSSGLDVSTVSRHAKRLEDAGLLSRTEDPDDRRVSRLQVTERGSTLLEEAMGARAAALAEGMAGWSATDRASITTLLTRLARSVSPDTTATNSATTTATTTASTTTTTTTTGNP